MSQSNAAANNFEQLPEDRSASATQTVPQSDQQPKQPRPGEQPKREPEKQDKVEQVSKIDVYVGTERDQALFKDLNHWRDLKLCACISTYDRLGLSKTFEVYVRDQVKRRPGVILMPAPVAYVEVEQNGSATDLLISILSFLSNELDCGYLKELRNRTWGTLKAFGVKILIINNAGILSYKAFWELVRIHEKLEISVVIADQPHLRSVIAPKGSTKEKYTVVHNTFLRSHDYRLMSLSDTKAYVQQWEAKLNWSRKLQLADDPEIVRSLHRISQGQLAPLFEALREVAVWKIDHPKAQVNYKNIDNLLKTYLPPYPQVVK